MLEVSPIAIRRLLRRRRHDLALVAAIVALSAAIAVHHSGMSIGDMDHDMGVGALVQMCLGVVVAIGAAVVAVALGIVELGRWRTPLVFAPATRSAARGPAPRTRDGPGLLRLLCVRRC